MVSVAAPTRTGLWDLKGLEVFFKSTVPRNPTAQSLASCKLCACRADKVANLLKNTQLCHPTHTHSAVVFTRRRNDNFWHLTVFFFCFFVLRASFW